MEKKCENCEAWNRVCLVQHQCRCQRMENWKPDYETSQKIIQSLLAERDLLVKALEFYSDKKNYKFGIVEIDFDVRSEVVILTDRDCEMVGLQVHGGKLARETLAKIKRV